MPLVRMELMEGKPGGCVQGVGEAVHRAMIEILKVSERDHFQVVGEHQTGRLTYDPGYLDVETTDDCILIQILLATGRSIMQKWTFHEGLTALLEEKPGMHLEDVAVGLVEIGREGWSFEHGHGQYLVLPEEQWK